MLVVAAVMAQVRDCPLPVTARADPTGYQPRGNRCEGMFVGLHSAPLKVQVVSLVTGGLRYDLAQDTLLYIHVPPLPAKLSSVRAVVLQGRGREANLNWALDASTGLSSSLTWELSQVVRPRGITSNRIGLAAQARTSALGDPLFIPLGVSRDPTARPGTGDSLELIVRVPGASGARWAFATDTGCRGGEGAGCRGAVRLNVDGYFRIVIPPGPEGEATLAVFWRPRGTQKYNAVPEHLRIYRR
ncbi:MAG TPA: hypothetical protein VFZ21_03775 [Gemmatimonadaceae bacterium]|jgi:hypothetical protein|nr:hypothetical protein [Gemmatimonadaceae bacterium]